jgi:hypothetical protein
MTARFVDRQQGLPIEQFIQALTSQLDRAQTALALKARAGLPLTFAVKDLTLDLRAVVEMSGSVVRIRPAGPGETESSTLRVALTTITRPQIEENTQRLATASGEPTLSEAVGNQLSDDEIRRLEWAGVRTVSQLADLQEHAGPDALERVAQVPAMRLRAALERASHPFVSDVSTVEHTDAPPPLDMPPVAEPRPRRRTFDDLIAHDPDGGLPDLDVPPTRPAPRDLAPLTPQTPLIRVRGRNLVREGASPTVRIGGEAVPVLQANKRELLLAPMAHQLGGTMEIETAPGVVVTRELGLDTTGGEA